MNTWTWSWAIRNLVAELLMPPGIWVVIGLAALIFFRKRRRLQTISVAVMIWLTSTTFFAHLFVRASDTWMHWLAPVDIRTLPKATLNNQQPTEKLGSLEDQDPQAIVILGGGCRKGALDNPEYEFQDVSKESMERLRMGARLAKQTNLPILITGGAPDATNPNEQSEAKLMEDVLELNIKSTWIEGKSATTQENARLSAELLRADVNGDSSTADKLNGSITYVYLVTHFWYITRAKAIFEKAVFKMSAMPLAFDRGDLNSKSAENSLNPVDFAPSSIAIVKTRQLWREFWGVCIISLDVSFRVNG